jgi:hypothetical protein
MVTGSAKAAPTPPENITPSVAASGIDTRMERIFLLSLKMVPRVDSRFCTVASDHTY